MEGSRLDLFQPRTLAELELTFPPELDHLSASGLKTFMRCPETWRRRYLLDDKEKPNAAQAWGSADHDAIGWNLRSKLETGNDQPVPAVKEMFVAKLEERIEKEGGIGEVEFKDIRARSVRQKRKALGQMKDQGAALAGAYREIVCPQLEPVAIEEPFELDLRPNVPVKVVGYIDLLAHEVDALTRERLAKRPVMRDRKTSAASKQKPDQEWVFQGRVYQLAKPVPFRVDMSVKNKTPKVIAGVGKAEKAWLVQPWRTDRTLQLVEQLAAQIGFLYRRFGPNHPWPGAWTHPWACGYCGFKPTCPWWEGRA